MRNAAAQLAVLGRLAEEVDDLAQLVLGLLDAGDVREGDLVARGLVAAGSRPSERAEGVLHVAGPAEEPEEQEDEQDRRPESEQQRLPPGRARLERLGVDRDVVLLEQLGELVGVGERGNLRSEPRRRLRVLEGHVLLERPLDVRALGRDLLDVARPHLLQEERAVRDADPRLGPHRPRGDEQVECEQHEEEDDPAGRDPEPGTLGRRRRRSAGRGRRRLGCAAVGLLGHGPRLLSAAFLPPVAGQLQGTDCPGSTTVRNTECRGLTGGPDD